MKRKILITGAAGYLGSMLVQTLQDEYDVRAIDNFSHGTVERVGDTEIEDLDITMPSHVTGMMYGIHTLIHMAGISGITPCEVQAENAALNNLVGLKNLIYEGTQACLRKVIFPSSMAVYGNPPPIVTEDTPRHPISFYGILKAAAEDLLIAAKERHGIDYLIFRQSNIFGKGLCEKHSIINASIRKALAGEPMVQIGDGKQVRDFIHLRRVMDIYNAVLHNDASGIYNLGFGTSVAIFQVLKEIGAAVHKETHRLVVLNKEPASSWQVDTPFAINLDALCLMLKSDQFCAGDVLADIRTTVREFIGEPACTT